MTLIKFCEDLHAHKDIAYNMTNESNLLRGGPITFPCIYKFIRGHRKGEYCDNPVYTDSPYCTLCTKMRKCPMVKNVCVTSPPKNSYYNLL